jgi:spoIIIJ-associated protein
MSEYQEFTGKTVEEALKFARETFDVGLDDLDFEILTPGSRGVLGMGAEPARIIAAPRSALGGSAPRREAAAATPLPPPPRESYADREDRGDQSRSRDSYRGGRDRDRSSSSTRSDQPYPSSSAAPAGATTSTGTGRSDRDRGRSDRGRRDYGRDRDSNRDRSGAQLSAGEQEEVRASRARLSVEREEIQAAEASPEALAAGREILQELLTHMGLEAEVNIETGDTSKLDVKGQEHEKESLGALIGRKGERLSALQHLVNLMLSRRLGEWTRVLVDVEDYRGRRERQLREIALRAADRVTESGKMLQLEPMPALERRWIHLALRENPNVATQSIGEEPHRRVVIILRQTAG